MKNRTSPALTMFATFAICCAGILSAQEPSSSASSVPRLVSFSSTLVDAHGKSIAGVTFSIYKDREGGAPLWIETQNVTVDEKGRYTVQLGATRSAGLPNDLFSSKESRWLGVTVSGQEEQPRVLLLSVPYALKAADSETLGGLPASAFMLAAANASFTAGSASPSSSAIPPASTPTVTGAGTANYLPLWTDSAGTLGNSVLFQTGTGSTTKVGINTTSPLATLDVQGTGMVHGQFTMASAGNATASSGKKSYPLDLRASAFNSGTSAAVMQNFVWEAEPVGNNSSSPSGSLNLLFAQGIAAPAETGLKIASNGLITFASGQTFPGGGGGSVTSVALSAPASDFTVSGSPVTKSGTLGLNWKLAPTDAPTANTIVKRDANGGFSAGTVTAQAIIANNASGGVGVIANSSSSVGLFGGSDTNAGVWGTSVSGDGLLGETNGSSAFGVYGHNLGVNGVGVYGSTSGNTGTGVLGFGEVGVQGSSASIDGSGAGVYALGRAGSSGLYATTGDGGWAVNAYNTGAGTGVLAGSFAGWAAWFNGDVEVDGNLHKEGGSFKIDHPLDPANKYLYHSFVESPDMMNIYNGNVTTDGHGTAVVNLPDWFETLNRDFRYQLTVIGQFAQAIVSREIASGRFAIKTDKPNVKVSWQVTGIRHDAWANAHRIPLEEVKPEAERGAYLHPELYGAPEEKSILWARSPGAMKRWKETRLKAAQKIDASATRP